jgi:hypothetical protein
MRRYLRNISHSTNPKSRPSPKYSSTRQPNNY